MGGQIPGRIKKDLIRRLGRAKKVLFFLDYDGTLAPIRRRPGLALMPPGARRLVKKLSLQKWAGVYIISGRTLQNVKSLIRIPSISYSGNHGIELESPGFTYVSPAARAAKPYIQKCYRALKRKIKIKGAIIENKIYTLSVHYRMVRAGRIGEIEKILSGLKFNKKVRVRRGKKVFEVRPSVNWHKGKIVKLILKRKKAKFALPIYIGDDITDEDAFRALGRRGVSALVSGRRRKTAARYRLRSPAEVLALLEFIYESMDKKS